MIFRLVMWIGLLISGTAFAQSTVGDPVASRSATAKQHYERGEYEDALRLYRDALLERPDSPSLRFNVGDVLFKLGDYDGAMQEYKAALADADTELKSDTFYNLGNTLFQQQQLDPAIGAYKNALEAQPGNQDAKANLELAQRFLEQQQQQQQQNQEEESGDQDQEEKQGQQEGGGQEGDRREQEKTDASQERGQQDGQQQQQATAAEPEPGQDELTPAAEQTAMDPEEAARIMAALKDREKEMQQRRFRGTAGRGEKDW